MKLTVIMIECLLKFPKVRKNRIISDVFSFHIWKQELYFVWICWCCFIVCTISFIRFVQVGNLVFEPDSETHSRSYYFKIQRLIKEKSYLLNCFEITH